MNNNGYEFVDLNLPSHTLWATCNVGASKPSEYGLYFQWGDIQGYTQDQIGLGDGQKKFSSDWNDYKWLRNDAFTNYRNAFVKYRNGGMVLDILDLEDDAAHANMGGDWHMPTPEQIQELIDETTTAWTTQDGVNGRLFTSKKDTSKSIFIPAGGFALNGSVYDRGVCGFVWSSMLSTSDVNGGQLLSFNLYAAYLYDYCRDNGFSVRGVIG